MGFEIIITVILYGIKDKPRKKNSLILSHIVSKSFRLWLAHPFVDFKMLSKYDGMPVYVGLGPDNNAKICGYFVDLQCTLPTQTNVHVECLKYICTVYRPMIWLWLWKILVLRSFHETCTCKRDARG